MLHSGLILVASKKKYTLRKDGTKVFGPYKGSAANGGRPIMVVKKKDGSSSSTNAARYKYESKNGRLARGQDVNHKDNGGRSGHDSMKNLNVMSHSKNVADGNRRRKPQNASRKRTAAR